MSQLLGLVSQMYGNEGVTNIIYSTSVWTTERSIAEADPQNILEPPTDGGYLCSDPISALWVIKKTNDMKKWTWPWAREAH